MADLNLENYDGVEERMIKVYPYEFVKASKSEEFVGNQTVSVVAISQKLLDSRNELLLQDESGNKYFEMFAAITSEGKLDFSTSTSALGQELKEEDSFSCLSNWYYESEIDKIKVGNLRLMPAMFTVGKPFDERLYNQDLLPIGWYKLDNELDFVDRRTSDDSNKLVANQAGELLSASFESDNNREPFDGERYLVNTNWYEYVNEVSQPAFLSVNMIEAEKGESQFKDESIDPEGLYEFSMVNVSVLESSFANSLLKFSTVIGDHFVDDPNWNPTTDANNSIYKVPGFSLELQTDSLVNRVTARGKVEELDTDIDFKVKEQLTPMKATPMETQDKLTMFMDWFDYDSVMPEFIAVLFMTGASLNDLKNVDIDNNGTKTPFFSDAQVNLVSDMLAYSSAFASSFANFERNASGSDAGKIKADQTIGTKKAKLVAIEGKDSIKVIDGLFEEYIREYPADDNSIEFRALKQILNALSRYIYSSYCIGKGQNSFNQVYLPWYLTPMENILITSTSNNWSFDPSKKFQISSRWFTVANGKIEPPTGMQVSDVTLIQADRKTILPELPNTIAAINKLPLPGDIDTKSSEYLKYMWYLPLSQLEFEKLYLNDVSVTTDNKNEAKVFDTRWTSYGHEIPTDENAFIKSEAVNKYSVIASKVNVVTGVGSIESTTGSATSSGLNNISKGGGTPSGDQGVFNIPLWATLPDTGVIAYRGARNLNNDQVKTIISSVISVPEDAIEVINNNARYVKSSRTSSVEWQGTTYALKRFRVVGAKVLIDGRTTTISIDRDTLYDKVGWHFFVNDFLNVSSALKEFHFVEERGLNIQDIQEITISQIWGDSAVLHLGFASITIPLFNKDDETIGTQRIIFT